MNVQSTITALRRVRLRVEDFLALKEADRFDSFLKAELFEGELLGVVRTDDADDQTDELVSIKLTLADYSRLSDSGSFEKLRKTELIDGVVYEVSPQHRPHGFAKDELAYRLRQALARRGSPWHVATEQSVAIPPHSEPQPDIILTTEPQGSGAIPGSTIGLLVEISVSTIHFDMNEKMRVYSSAGIPEYWVVDIAANKVHLFWTPASKGYTDRRTVALGETITAVTIDALEVDTSGV